MAHKEPSVAKGALTLKRLCTAVAKAPTNRQWIQGTHPISLQRVELRNGLNWHSWIPHFAKTRRTGHQKLGCTAYCEPEIGFVGPLDLLWSSRLRISRTSRAKPDDLSNTYGTTKVIP